MAQGGPGLSTKMLVFLNSQAFSFPSPPNKFKHPPQQLESAQLEMIWALQSSLGAATGC